MTDTLRNMPRYIRQTDAFGWQGADSANGPWRSITPPQSGTPWQTTNPMDDLRQAARWGADQELDACCEWLDNEIGASDPKDLRAARRPKPLSLKEKLKEAIYDENLGDALRLVEQLND